MKTFYPNILSFAAAWALRVFLILIGMAIAVRFLAQDNCNIQISSEFDNPTIDCSAPIPAFAPFSASSNCCDGPVDITYFESQGSAFVENCIAATAMGPGPDWSVWLPNLPGGLSQYWHFIGAPTWQAFNDGTAHLQGVLVMQGNAANQFVLDIWFHNGMNWSDWSALGRGYKDDLNLGITSHLDWMYYEMVTNFAVLTGSGNLAGSQLTLTHQPANLYYGFQSGLAANNRNANQGASGWFFYNGVVNGTAANGHGDINIDNECQGMEGCANTKHTLVARAEDACGQVGFASQSITIVDSSAPVVNEFEPIITMDCEDYQGVFITAQDNCSDVQITYTDQSEGGCSTVTRTYLVADACGNSTTAIQTIVLSAGAPPMFTVFPDTLNLECDQADAIPTPEVLWQVGCGGEELEITTTTMAGSCPNEYTIFNTYIVTDNCGGSDTAVWVINVEDTTAPELFNVPSDMDILCGEEIPDVNVFALDNCDQDVITSLSAETIWGTCGYDFIRTWTSTDACGNTVSASQTIHVDDTGKPNFSFVPPSVFLECGTPFELTIPTAEDACSAVEMEWSDVDLEDCAGSYARIFRAFDGCGNSRLATVFVMFSDTEAPEMIEFPADVFVTCNTLPSQGDITVAWQDNCGNVTAEVSEITVQGDCPGEYIIERTWELTDDCGNTSAHTWNINVSDDEAPVILGVPADEVIGCGEEITEAVVVAEDNCVESPVITLTAETFVNDCGYTFVRTWTAVDGCGNSATAIQSTTVEDNTIPYFSYVPPNINVACSNEEYDDTDMAVAADECSSVTVTFFDSVIEGNCGNGVLRTFVATDGCGNVAMAEQIISYSDNVPPVFTFVPDEIMADCGDEIVIPMAEASDECSDVIITFADEQLSACGGSFMRTFTATDGCGNQANAAVNVIYNDGETPQITNGPADLIVNCDAIPTIESADLQFTDNCGNIEISQSEIRVDGECNGNYTLIRTYTLTDDCGNVSEWIWTLGVVDNEGPEILGVPISTSIGCGEEISPAQVVATDNCDESPILDLDAQTVFNACGYDFIRTWTATDHCGNTTVQTQIINVTDDLPPSFTYVPSDVNFTCGTLGDIEMATALDECSEVIVTFEDEIIDEFSGSFIRHWIATDGCGNFSEDNTLVTFDTAGPPAILCPGNQEVNAGTNCSAVLPDYTTLVWVETTCIDPLSITVTQTPAAGTTINADTEVSMTVNALGGQSASCSFLVVVLDDLSPIVACPGNQLLDLNTNCSAFLPDYAALVVANDNCSALVEVTQTPAPGTSIQGLNPITVMMVITDLAGNESTCSFDVIPVDTTPPFFTNFPDNSTADCSFIPGVELADVQYADACGGVTVEFDEIIISNSGSCPSEYTIQRTWTLTDESGNEISQTWEINVEDNIAPLIIGVPGDMSINCGDPIADAQVVATDNCDEVVDVSLEATTVSTDCGYIFQRTWTAVDDCGNTSSAVQNITVEDDLAPVFEFVPADSEISCENYMSELSELPLATANDECSIVVVSFIDVADSDCSGSFERQWSAIDGCGNTAQATTHYLVVDIDAPEFTTVPDNMSVEGCNAIPEPNMDEITYTENCSAVTITVADDAFELDCPNNQIVYRTWRLTDACGNQSSYTQEIYVFDETGPQIIGVPPNGILNCGELPEEVSITAIDNCSSPEDITISLHAKTTQLACGNIFVRVWTATDACGNSSYATQEITYIDNTPPTFEFVPADFSIDCGNEYILEEPVVTDMCSTVSYTILNSASTCSGSYERTFIATDGCGNSAEASQFITINDFTAPIPDNLPADVIVYNCNEVPFVDQSAVTFTDNCSSVEVGFSSDTTYYCGNSFHVVFQWTGLDACGNSETVTMNLDVLDQDGPTFTLLPVDHVLNCGDVEPEPIVSTTDACGSAYIEFTETTIDLGCGYQIQRTWFAFDECNNINTHVQLITYEDNAAPVFVNAPQDMSLECTDIVPTPALVLGMDDCQGLVAATLLSEEIVAGSCNSNYQIIRTYQLVDECGNTTNHEQTITVADTQGPGFFDFDAELEVICTLSNGVFATAFDECSSIGVSYDDDLLGTGCNGQIVRTYTATDACGNATTAIQTISLIDVEGPYFNIFPADINAECSNIPAPESAVVTFADNCSNPSISMIETIADGSCTNEYLILREYILTDACGNQTAQTWTITVQDLTAPEILGVPSESYIECGDAVPSINPFAFDQCDINPTLSMSAETVPTPSGCGSMFIRSWVATDACGNESTVSHTTFITDTTAPILSENPSDLVVPCAEGLPAAAVITAMDGCDGEVEVIYEESSLIGNCVNVIREWCATDCAGNQTCHLQTIFRTTAPALANGPQISAYNSDRHQLNISVLASNDGRWNLDVYDLTGRKITNLLAQDMISGQRHSFALDCNGFTDTMYILKWSNGETQVLQKVVIMK